MTEFVFQKRIAGILFGLSQITLARADADNMPFNYKSHLPPLAALTPIHTHLAVQYQMCVIMQLPHVILLATTLRQGAPTSLSKCLFG